ncbi:5'-nucleotidase [Oerskovia sp. M15]
MRVSIVTARSAPSHERAVNTLRSWGVTVNDAFFLGGADKGRVLRVLRPHIFFDDQRGHLAPVAREVASVLVPYGVTNEAKVARSPEPDVAWTAAPESDAPEPDAPATAPPRRLRRTPCPSSLPSPATRTAGRPPRPSTSASCP